ncbi:hypothetical protein [Parabacteroides bouchesdurhonensis]|uniref:hypothetical protein n=1 Tax=Parabacteroides bouchesdurhonensis TaxID=1936995 RepID=UPI000C81AA18|nr:hypothetical protein [Parabacteroides bouchesdurhonensis]
MKDINITITTKRQRTEILIWGVCFVLAFLLNIISIIVFDTEWKELFTQLLWVLSLSIGFYFLTLALRIIYWLIRCAFSKKQK